MGKRARIGLIAGAMAMAITGRGCVTTPPPVTESVVAGSSTVSRETAASAPAGPAAAQTPDERRAALDKQLDDSLGDFDAKLHKEQQKTAEERDARQATVSATSTAAAGATAAGGSGTSAGAPGTSAGAPTAVAASTGTSPGASTAATSSADGSDSSMGTGADGASATEVPGPHRGRRGETRSSRAGDLKSDKGTGGTTSASGNGAPATIIPDGNDDDIVARRLRKAAELETDPELKDKLWKEYVEYKKNTQVR